LNLKGVLIDFGQTLAYLDREDDRRFRGELASVLGRYGCRRTSDEISHLLDNAYRGSTKGEVKDLHEFWKLLLKSLGIPERSELIQELTELRSRHVATGFKLYGEAVSVLSTLKKKYKLALVSNCGIGLSDVVRALGLADFFHCIVLSYEVGVRKPDRRIYLEALNTLKFEPQQCIFVADEISDLEGAREVGLKTLLVRQGEYTTHNTKDPSFKPDYQCNHISEITMFL